MPLNRPTQAELLAAVGDYLRHPPNDPTVDRFLRRVSANVLGICQREAEQGEAYLQQDAAFYQQCQAALGVDTLEELTIRLAAGVEDAWLRPRMADWLALAEAKLAIDSPRYPRG